jgi:hypothetical protein
MVLLSCPESTVTKAAMLWHGAAASVITVAPGVTPRLRFPASAVADTHRDVSVLDRDRRGVTDQSAPPTDPSTVTLRAPVDAPFDGAGSTAVGTSNVIDSSAV